MKGHELAYKANMGAKEGEIKHLQVLKGQLFGMKGQEAAYKANMGANDGEIKHLKVGKG